MFLKARRILIALVDSGACPTEDSAPWRVGPLVVAPEYSEGHVRWAPVYWLALGPVILCWRSAPTSRGLGVHRSVLASVRFGIVV